MTDLQDLIQSADKLCASLDKAAANDKKFCDEICIELERMAWNTFKIKNDLKKINDYQLGN